MNWTHQRPTKPGWYWVAERGRGYPIGTWCVGICEARSTGMGMLYVSCGRMLLGEALETAMWGDRLDLPAPPEEPTGETP